MSAEKIKEISVDRLSGLPDDILHYILSFLEMKNAAITCLLSKRWQFLWTELPALRFKLPINYIGDLEKQRKFVIRVHRTLAFCNRHNLERFEVDFKEDYTKCFDSDVNVWIGFAVKNKVKNFTLLLTNDYYDYKLPRMMYSNPSWTYLSLEGCIMAPRGTLRWQSLTTLCMRYVGLDESTFEKIFSGCPVLSSLDLELCYGFDRLEVSSRSLGTLTVEDLEEGGHREISAPYIHTFSIDLGREYQKLSFENFESLVSAEIIIDDIYDWNKIALRLWRKRIKQLFGSIRHVKMLKLGRGSIKLLSLIAPGRQLPQSTRGYLELHTCSGGKSVPGILSLLESSPNLETLVIHVDRFFYWDYFRENSSSKLDLNCDLFHLKTVNFYIFRDPNLDFGEPILTLARILLKRATVLEKMVVNFHRLDAPSSAASRYTITQKLLSYLNISQKSDKIIQKLLSYPRISQKAVVLFC